MHGELMMIGFSVSQVTESLQPAGAGGRPTQVVADLYSQSS
jgi:hypothetical protein